ncbi:PREDICTED: hematopoietic cell signal transducer isoform X3 [Colobus angolensis palliatus]|uniref:hematopoietic cell signal transducer isoform X3 n=1 Tax=Colobus angolensis palliatus TaxID=336983 RepID=UPI0005F3FB52|nr:PREDICTED: hematopoietic cell signal transducer isoform X3 [Colobus angolensis palliatus]
MRPQLRRPQVRDHSLPFTLALQAPVPDVGPSLCRSWQASWRRMRWRLCSSWGRCSCAHAHAAAPPKKRAKSTSTCRAGADPPATWTFDF